MLAQGHSTPSPQVAYCLEVVIVIGAELALQVVEGTEEEG
jgi:hypothetical protein